MGCTGNTGLNYCYNCMTELQREQTICPVCGHDNSLLQNPENALPAGTILAGKYLVGKVLGRGGFSISYLGFDLSLNLRIVIKENFPVGIGIRMPDSLRVAAVSDSENSEIILKGCDQLEAEARYLSQFECLNSVKVLDCFRENGTAYIVMKYLPGKTLCREAEDCGGKIPWQRVIALFAPLIRDLDKLHEEQLVHRDISPDNILIIKEHGGTERLALLSFDSALNFVSPENTDENFTALVMPGYSPIEQYSLKSRQGPYSDVYALCATMYAMITGEVPPSATDRMMGVSGLKGFSDFGVSVPENIDCAILHGLAIRSSDRTQTMRDLYQELYGTSNDSRVKTLKSFFGSLKGFQNYPNKW